MKKIKLIVLTLILMLSYARVNAAEVSITGNDKVYIGDEIEIQLNIKKAPSDENIFSIQSTLEYDSDKLEYVSDSGKYGNWQRITSESNFPTITYLTYSTSDTDAITSTDITNVYNVKFKVKDSAEIGNTTISISDTTDSHKALILTGTGGNDITVDNKQSLTFEIAKKAEENTANNNNTTTEDNNTNQDKEKNPQSGISFPIVGLTVILVGGVGMYIYSKKKNQFPNV